MLGVVGIRLWRGRLALWVYIFRESIASVSVLAVVWALWVLISLPLFVRLALLGQRSAFFERLEERIR